MALLPYNPTPADDAKIVRWWLELRASGELQLTFGEGSLALSNFFKLLRESGLCLLDYDAEGVAVCIIVSPVMSGVFLTLWVAPRHRASKAALLGIEEAYEGIFQSVPVILGVTRQQRLLRVHRAWGYDIIGQIPQIFDGHDGWLVALTPQAFHVAVERRHARWARTDRESAKSRSSTRSSSSPASPTRS